MEEENIILPINMPQNNVNEESTKVVTPVEEQPVVATTPQLEVTPAPVVEENTPTIAVNNEMPTPEFPMADMTNPMMDFQIDPEIMKQFIEMQQNMDIMPSIVPNTEVASEVTTEEEPKKEVNYDALSEYLTDKNIFEITYHNHGMTHIKSLATGIEKIEKEDLNDDFVFALASDLSKENGRTFDAENPFLIVNNPAFKMSFIHPSMTNNGISLTLRRRSEGSLSDEEIKATNYVPELALNFLKAAVEAGLNISISGVAGSGKTEFAKYLMKLINPLQKVIYFEEATLKDDKYENQSIISVKKTSDENLKDLLAVEAPNWVVISGIAGDDIGLLEYALSSGFSTIFTVNAKSASLIPHKLYNLTTYKNKTVQENYYDLLEIGVYISQIYDKEKNTFVYEITEIVEYLKDANNNLTVNKIYEKTDKNRYKVLSKNLINKLLKKQIDLSAISKLIPKGLISKVEVLETKKPQKEEPKEVKEKEEKVEGKLSSVLTVPKGEAKEVFISKEEAEEKKQKEIQEQAEAQAKKILGITE